MITCLKSIKIVGFDVKKMFEFGVLSMFLMRFRIENIKKMNIF